MRPNNLHHHAALALTVSLHVLRASGFRGEVHKTDLSDARDQNIEDPPPNTLNSKPCSIAQGMPAP